MAETKFSSKHADAPPFQWTVLILILKKIFVTSCKVFFLLYYISFYYNITSISYTNIQIIDGIENIEILYRIMFGNASIKISI